MDMCQILSIYLITNKNDGKKLLLQGNLELVVSSNALKSPYIYLMHFARNVCK